MRTINKTKIKLTVSIFTVAIFLLTVEVFPQTLIDNTGGIIENEMGVLKVKTTGRLLFGQQDTIGGTVMFEAQDPGRAQIVPNITYNKLILNAYSWLYIDSVEIPGQRAYGRPMTVLDSFVVLSGVHTKARNSRVETHAKGNVFNNGAIRGTRDVVMNSNTTRQTIDGDNQGSFSRLRIDNPHGVEVVGGGFTVTNKLELKVGELDNSNVNFSMGYANSAERQPNVEQTETAQLTGYTEVREVETDLDRPLIVRHTTGSVRERPILLEDSIDIHYVGAGSMHTGAEVPKTDGKYIHSLQATNTDSLILSENVDVHDNIYIGTHIHTVSEDTLSLISVKNPEFHPNNPDAEVHGNFRRVGWRDGDTIVFNNYYTTLLFRESVPRSQISQIVSTIYPGRWHSLPEGDKNKVRREITLRAMNAQYVEYTDSIDAVYGYGWRHNAADGKDETLDLAFEKMMLLQYNAVGNRPWVASEASVVPAQNNALGRWGHSYTTDIKTFGHYAIGLNIIREYLALTSKTYLEGAYIFGSVNDDTNNRRMRHDLQERNYLPMPPPDIWPYNLDAFRETYVRLDQFGSPVFPDSVVDWIVLEFRKEYSIAGHRKTFLLKTDGRIVDIYGNEQILFDENGRFAAVDSLGKAPEPQDSIPDAQLYVLLLHRNHAAVISDRPVPFTPDESVFVDFTLPATVLGGVNALRQIDRQISDGTMSYIYGMIAGNINNGMRPDNVIDRRDYESINLGLDDWSIGPGGTLDGYLIRDLNLSGTINTLDFNIGFNNRGRIVFAPLP